MKNRILYSVILYKANNKTISTFDNIKQNLLLINNSSNYKYNIKSKIINNPQNLGFGGAANMALQYAINNNFDWVVILNQDIKFNNKFFSNFATYLKKTSPSIIGPFTGAIDTKRWSSIIPATSFAYVSGSCIAIHREVIKKIGFFYEPYFMYYEDVDFCIRATINGFNIYNYNSKFIKHDDMPMLGKGSFLHEYYLNRNHLLLIERLAPLNVKIRELLRLPLTIIENINNFGALTGLFHYFIRNFGPYANRT